MLQHLFSMIDVGLVTVLSYDLKRSQLISQLKMKYRNFDTLLRMVKFVS